jgi:hypothetical protein
MKHLVLIAAAATLGFAGPALAQHGHQNGRGHDNNYNNYNANDRNCPPGLAKKHNGCMAPGQARRLARGQRYQSGYGTLYSYGRIPSNVRSRYGLNSRYRYYYDNGNLYQVDPRTMLVQQVISALLR